MHITTDIAVFYAGFAGIAWSVWSTWTYNQKRKLAQKEETKDEPEEQEKINVTALLFPELTREVKTIQTVKVKRSPLEGYDPCPGYTLWKANPDGYTPPKEEPKEPPRKKKKKK